MELYRTHIPADHFTCHFFLMSKTSVKEAAEALAIGQSIGNPSVRSRYETPEMMENHSAKIIADPDNLANIKAGVVEIAWPYRNIDWYADGIAQLMCTVMGGQMDIDIIEQCHWIDIHIDRVKADLSVPSYGLTGFRDHVQQYDKPLLGTIVKPKTGLTAETLKDIVTQMVDGGVDFIKEDEIFFVYFGSMSLPDHFFKVFIRLCKPVFDFFNHILWHGYIDFTCQFYEPRIDSVLTGLPSQVKGVDRKAVPPKPRAGVKGHVTEGLGFSGFDDFPNIDAQFMINDFHFVHEGDVHTAENVFQKLGGFGGAAGGNRHRFLYC